MSLGDSLNPLGQHSPQRKSSSQARKAAMSPQRFPEWPKTDPEMDPKRDPKGYRNGTKTGPKMDPEMDPDRTDKINF